MMIEEIIFICLHAPPPAKRVYFGQIFASDKGELTPWLGMIPCEYPDKL